MQETILALLRLFRAGAPDPETADGVSELAASRARWPGAKELFSQVRKRLLDASDRLRGRSSEPGDGKDAERCSQYCFEELCLKTLFNETDTRIPFDPSSPFFVAPSAIELARAFGVPPADALGVIAYHGDPELAIYRRLFPEKPIPPAVSTPEGPTPGERRTGEFPDLALFPRNPPGPYERNMGDRIAGLLRLFSGWVPDGSSHAAVLKLARTPDRWSAGHALFEIVYDRLLKAMRARDHSRFLQHALEQSCLRALYNATSPVHPFARGAPFWIAGAGLALAKRVGVEELAVAEVLAPEHDREGS